jgi:exopolysaccharide production protein ExoY
MTIEVPMATLPSGALPDDATASPVLYIGEVRADAVFRRRVSTSPLFRLEILVKRLFDIVFSGLLLVFLSPVFLLAFFAVRISSPGPFIFSQLRWGLDERHFHCFKIRTMYVDQAARLVRNQSVEEKNRGILLKMKNDPRVTPVGAFLRRTSIDELPQLFNVFRGDMSIVGPRPLMLHMMDPFPQIRAVRSVVRPGLTGLWQIRNRANNTSVMNMIADDVDYISHLSLFLDAKTLIATPWELIRGTGAH